MTQSENDKGQDIKDQEPENLSEEFSTDISNSSETAGQDHANQDHTDYVEYVPIPRILGKFNYITYKGDHFNILFIPFTGDSAQIIARNLTREEAIDLIKSLNDELEITKDEFKSRANQLRSQRRSH